MPSNRKPSIPATLQRSPAKAQRTYAKTLEAAEREYDGDEERAHRTAFAAVKHSFEKVGDHWEPKPEQGPSDTRARAKGGRTMGETAGGVDAIGHTRDELYARATELGVRGRSRMTKMQLAQAIARKQD